MPSKTKPQAILMAMAARNPKFAKKRGISSSVAREFNQADKRTGILRKGAGGMTPNESGMDAKMNFGLGHGNSMFSTTPLMGHAFSGTQLGQADNAIRRAQKRFAEGGEVKKPAGPSAKERKEIRAIIERGKGDAIDALRATRTALAASMPPRPEAEDYDVSLSDLRDRLKQPIALADGGEVEEAPEVAASPEMLYEEYQTLMEQLTNEGLDESLQMEIVDRLAKIEGDLEAMGIDVTAGEEPPAVDEQQG